MATGAGIALLTCTTVDLLSIGYLLSALAVVCACVISIYDVHEHFLYWHNPQVGPVGPMGLVVLMGPP